jgi:hypothetical protein
MNKNLKTISFAFAMFAVVGMISSTSAVFADDDGIELEAKLVENDIEILEASFEIEDGINELEIEVEGQSDATCSASINGNPVDPASFQLDDEGEVELELFEPIVFGDEITVDCDGFDPLTATFVLDVDEEDGEEEDGHEEEEEELKIQSSKKGKSNHGR